MIELWQASVSNEYSSCYNDVNVSDAPCFMDSDHFLQMAERTFMGQSYYFNRLRLFQHPDADDDCVLTQNDDYLALTPPTCSEDDEYLMRTRSWLDVWFYEFEETWSDCLSAGPCCPYWFVTQ